jgi:DNA-binding transcriptional regulator GbsR (MarR family)
MATAVGDFIRYWGFRRIHGQIWTQIYLSKSPLSGADLTRSLGVSKALVSPALLELLDFQLILAVETTGNVKKYTANPDVFRVIVGVLSTREKRLIDHALKTHQQLTRSLVDRDPAAETIDPERLRELGDMISLASSALLFVVSQYDFEGAEAFSIFKDLCKV